MNRLFILLCIVMLGHSLQAEEINFTCSDGKTVTVTYDSIPDKSTYIDQLIADGIKNIKLDDIDSALFQDILLYSKYGLYKKDNLNLRRMIRKIDVLGFESLGYKISKELFSKKFPVLNFPDLILLAVQIDELAIMSSLGKGEARWPIELLRRLAEYIETLQILDDDNFKEIFQKIFTEKTLLGPLLTLARKTPENDRSDLTANKPKRRKVTYRPESRKKACKPKPGIDYLIEAIKQNGDSYYDLPSLVEDDC